MNPFFHPLYLSLCRRRNARNVKNVGSKLILARGLFILFVCLYIRVGEKMKYRTRQDIATKDWVPKLKLKHTTQG